jgi:hypothetical protein
MARQDNGGIDLSLPIFDIEGALHDYAYSPSRGLEKLQLALLSLQKSTQLTSFHNVYHSRLSSFIAAVNRLSASGAPYVEHYHSAFLSAADALFQVVIAYQFDEDRSQQLDYLLLEERSCWNVVMSVAAEQSVSPNYVNYIARLDSTQSGSVSVDAYLDALACAGRVSFHLDTVTAGSINGRFMLVSVQPLAWLQARFAYLQWQVHSINEDEPLRVLCELSFLPIFQNASMQREVRYRLLALFEDRLKTLFYQKFDSLFSVDSIHIENPNQLVPVSCCATAFEYDEGSSYFPARHGGFVFIGQVGLGGGTLGCSDMVYLDCLGHDFLAYFLYEIETSSGRLAFEQSDCLGSYVVDDDGLYAVGDSLWLSIEDKIQAQVLLTMPLLSPDKTPYCLLPQYFEQVFVVKQAGQYFALPYSTMREVEGVCSVMTAPRSWVKNIWLSKTNEPLLEPWLLGTDRLPKLHCWSEKNKSTRLSKNGYYFGKVCGRMFWVEAELVLALLPYQMPFSFVHANDDQLNLLSFIVHDGCCFDKVFLKDASNGSVAAESTGDKEGFSVILEGMSESLVLPFSSCDWRDSLPDGHYVQTFNVPSESLDDSGCAEKLCFTTLQEGAVVINKKNYLSFVAGFCHLHH